MTQLLQKMQQFKKKEKEQSKEKLNILIWMPLYLLVIVLIQNRELSSESGHQIV